MADFYKYNGFGNDFFIPLSKLIDQAPYYELSRFNLISTIRNMELGL